MGICRSEDFLRDPREICVWTPSEDVPARFSITFLQSQTWFNPSPSYPRMPQGKFNLREPSLSWNRYPTVFINCISRENAIHGFRRERYFYTSGYLNGHDRLNVLSLEGRSRFDGPIWTGVRGVTFSGDCKFGRRLRRWNSTMAFLIPRIGLAS